MKINPNRIANSILMELPYDLALKLRGPRLCKLVRDAVEQEVKQVQGLGSGHQFDHMVPTEPRLMHPPTHGEPGGEQEIQRWADNTFTINVPLVSPPWERMRHNIRLLSCGTDHQLFATTSPRGATKPRRTKNGNTT